MNKYKVVFCGTPDIAAGILDTLNKMNNVEVLAAISQPDRPLGRKHILTATPVKKYCEENNIKCLQPEKISSIYDELKGMNYDFLITCAFGQFIPTKILELAKIDNLNIHGSLLPKYRGGAPIQYSIIKGDKTTGVSLMRMVKKMDAGAVFKELEVNIEPIDTTGTMFEKIEELGKKIIKDNLELVANGTLKPVEQDESKVTFAYNITSEQEQIDWSKENDKIDCLVRGLSPRPIAFTMNKEKRFKIGEVKLVNNNDAKAKPGQILEFRKDGILVQTKRGQILITQIQRTGKKMQPASIYYGNNIDDLKIGDIFNTYANDIN